MTQLILKDTQAELLAYLPRDPAYPLAQPTGVTFAVRTPALDSLGTPVAATVDPVVASTVAIAKRGSSQLSFGASPGAVARRLYVLSHPSFSAPFYVQVSGVSGTTVYLTDPLPCNIPAGSTLLGAALTLALTLAQTAEIDHLQTSIAHVEATAGGVTRRWDHGFRIVRQEFARVLTVPKLLKLAPEVMRLRSDGSDTYGELIDSAYEYLIQDLEGRGYEIARVNSPEKLNLTTVKRIRWALYDAINGPAHDDTKEAEAQYRDQLKMAEAGLRFWYDEADNDAPTGRQNPSRFSTTWLTR